jgi:hypothetical protein
MSEFRTLLVTAPPYQPDARPTNGETATAYDRMHNHLVDQLLRRYFVRLLRLAIKLHRYLKGLRKYY